MTDLDKVTEALRELEALQASSDLLVTSSAGVEAAVDRAGARKFKFYGKIVQLLAVAVVILLVAVGVQIYVSVTNRQTLDEIHKAQDGLARNQASLDELVAFVDTYRDNQATPRQPSPTVAAILAEVHAIYCTTVSGAAGCP